MHRIEPEMDCHEVVDGMVAGMRDRSTGSLALADVASEKLREAEEVFRLRHAGVRILRRLARPAQVAGIPESNELVPLCPGTKPLYRGLEYQRY